MDLAVENVGRNAEIIRSRPFAVWLGRSAGIQNRVILRFGNSTGANKRPWSLGTALDGGHFRLIDSVYCIVDYNRQLTDNCQRYLAGTAAVVGLGNPPAARVCSRMRWWGLATTTRTSAGSNACAQTEHGSTCRPHKLISPSAGTRTWRHSRVSP